MQNKGIVIMLGALAVLIAAVLAINLIGLDKPGASVPAYIPGSGEAAADTIAVYGQGKITITPDQATVTFGYRNESADPAAAQEKNKTQMEQIIGAVRSAGISDSDLQTVSYQVYRDESSKRFVVHNMTQIKLNDIKKTSAVIKAAYDAGANEFWNVRFDIIKRQQAYTDALHLAMERAREKAQKLAANEGRSIASVISVEEGTVDNSYYFSSPYSNFVGASSSSGGYTDGGISSGELEISALVSVTYRLN